MKTKQLGNSDLFITPVHFGASAWEQSAAAIHRALEFLDRISQTAATVLAIMLVAVIACFDYVTGDFSLTLFYLVRWFWLPGTPAVSADGSSER